MYAWKNTPVQTNSTGHRQDNICGIKRISANNLKKNSNKSARKRPKISLEKDGQII